MLSTSSARGATRASTMSAMASSTWPFRAQTRLQPVKSTSTASSWTNTLVPMVRGYGRRSRPRSGPPSRPPAPDTHDSGQGGRVDHDQALLVHLPGGVARSLPGVARVPETAVGHLVGPPRRDLVDGHPAEVEGAGG